MMYMLRNRNIHTLMSIFLLFILPQEAPPSRRNLRGPKRCSRTWTGWPFHLQSWWGSGTDWLRHLLLGNMFSISEQETISGQQHWETIVLPSTDSQGILGLLAHIGNNVLFMLSLKIRYLLNFQGYIFRFANWDLFELLQYTKQNLKDKVWLINELVLSASYQFGLSILDKAWTPIFILGLTYGYRLNLKQWKSLSPQSDTWYVLF